MRFPTLLTLVFILTSAACDDTGMEPLAPLAATYAATEFRVTPQGESTIDVLAAGGTLVVSVASDYSTTGLLSIPASVTGEPFSASMEGIAVVSGSTVIFEQEVDSFVRDLSWTRAGSTLTVRDQPAGLGSFTITLTAQ